VFRAVALPVTFVVVLAGHSSTISAGAARLGATELVIWMKHEALFVLPQASVAT